MSVEQLAELDQHPLVSSVPECTRLVAHAYLARYLGTAGPGRVAAQEPVAEQAPVAAQEPALLGCEASLMAMEGPGSPVREHKRRRAVAPGAARRAIVFPCS